MTRGLMKSTSCFAIAAAAGLFATSAMAADLGGNCCADLEERVAELEATTARKGNRKVSLTVYGQVNQALFWHDSDEADAYRSDSVTIRDNGANMSRFGFRGEAQIRPDLTAGYVIEIGLSNVDLGMTGDNLTIRHNYAYIDSKTFGRVSLGQTSQVTDGLYEINLANAQKVPGVINEESAFMGGRYAATFADNIDGARKQGVYYRTPSLAGFVLSAGFSHDTDDGADDSNDYWEVALRYAGEFNGIRVAAGIGYRKMEDNTSAVWVADQEVILGSASVMHTPTGLFVSGGYASVDTNHAFDAGAKDSFWVMAGIEKNWFGYGNTTLFGEYGEIDYDNNVSTSIRNRVVTLDGNYWGLGVTQSIDAAATDLYLNFRQYELEDGQVFAGDDASVIAAGMLIKF